MTPINTPDLVPSLVVVSVSDDVASPNALVAVIVSAGANPPDPKPINVFKRYLPKSFSLLTTAKNDSCSGSRLNPLPPLLSAF